MAIRRNLSKSENLKSYLKRKDFNYIPVSGECFMDFSVIDSVFENKNIIKAGGAEELATVAELLGNSNVLLPMKQFGYTEEKPSEYETILKYDCGAVWKVVTKPNYFRDMLKAPLPAGKVDFERLFLGLDCFYETLPEEKQKIEYLHERGYFVEANSFGIWFSIYTLFMQFDEALYSLAADEGLIAELTERTRKVLLETIEEYLKMGADGVMWPDDMGTSQNLLFSPKIYEKHFFPVHRDIAGLCHKYGAIARMHSHGNIAKIMDYIVETGIDIIHPIGPGDNNDLAMFKRKWGDKICINGGFSKMIGTMDYDQIKQHIDSVLVTGLPGGGFIPCLESGIPHMDIPKMDYFLKYRDEALEKYRYLAG